MKNTYVFAVYKVELDESLKWLCGRQIFSTTMAGAVKLYEKTRSKYSDTNDYLSYTTTYPKEQFVLGIRKTYSSYSEKIKQLNSQK